LCVGKLREEQARWLGISRERKRTGVNRLGLDFVNEF